MELNRRSKGEIPKRSSTQHQPLDVQPFHEDFDTTVYLAQEIFLGDKYVFEDQLAGVGAAHTELVEFAGTGEARGAAVDDKGCDAF